VGVGICGRAIVAARLSRRGDPAMLARVWAIAAVIANGGDAGDRAPILLTP
jgi:hypothetical protein